MTSDNVFEPASDSTNTRLDSRFAQYCESYSAAIDTVTVDDIEFLVYPKVYRAESASTTATILKVMGDFTGQKVLDMGCGTGVLGVLAGFRGAERVVMADVNDAAVENARSNVEKHQLGGRCQVLCSDLFSAVGSETFDVILFNMPFLYAENSVDEVDLTAPTHLADIMPPSESFVDVGYATIRRFMSGAREHLTAGGVIYCTFANFGNQAALDSILKDCKLQRRTLASKAEPEYGLEYLAFEISPVAEPAELA